MASLPTTLSLGHPHYLVSGPNYSQSQKGHFSRSDCESPSLESTQRPLDLYFITMSLLVSVSISQTFKTHPLRKTILSSEVTSTYCVKCRLSV